MTVTANFTNDSGSVILLENYTADTGETFSGGITTEVEVDTGDFAYPEANAAGYALIDQEPNETVYSVTISQRTQGGGGGPRNGASFFHDGSAEGSETCYRAYVNDFGELWAHKIEGGTETDMGSTGIGDAYDGTVLQSLTIRRDANDHILVDYESTNLIDFDDSASPLSGGRFGLYLHEDSGASQEIDSLTSNATTGGESPIRRGHGLINNVGRMMG